MSKAPDKKQVKKQSKFLKKTALTFMVNWNPIYYEQIKDLPVWLVLSYIQHKQNFFESLMPKLGMGKIVGNYKFDQTGKLKIGR